MAVEIGKGAEALITFEQNVIKHRIKKSYRLSVIDIALRRTRTRREAKILSKLSEVGFPAPRLVNCNDSDKIEMSFVHGSKVRDILDEANCSLLCEDIGRLVARLHSLGIIHGDLTTSNMILDDSAVSIVFIDFGLSFFSEKIEDKAVDLHLLAQALESRHYKIWEKCFSCVIDSYKKHAGDAEAVIKRFERVELRGRNKAKV